MQVQGIPAVALLSRSLFEWICVESTVEYSQNSVSPTLRCLSEVFSATESSETNTRIGGTIVNATWSLTHCLGLCEQQLWTRILASGTHLHFLQILFIL